MSIETQFTSIQKDEEIAAYRLENARLRQVISCAVCAHCGDEIADQEWVIDDDGRLVHKSCLPDIARWKAA